MGKSGDSTPIPTTSELMDLAEFENTINNPNVSNMFGSQEFTRGSDGRQTATQQLSPELEGLLGNIFSNLGQGPSQFNREGNQYTDDMINGFSQRIGQRAGFNPSEYNSKNPISDLLQAPSNPIFEQPPVSSSVLPPNLGGGGGGSRGGGGSGGGGEPPVNRFRLPVIAPPLDYKPR